MSPTTEGREQWPMWRVLPTKPIVHASTTLWLCNYLWNGVVLSFWIVAGGGTVPGSQPQKSPTSATNCNSDPSGLTMDGQSRTNGQQALKIIQWNAEGVRLKKMELQYFLKLKAIDVCCIQETHLSSSHRFFIRGYEVFRQDRENRPKGGLLTLVRNNIPAAEIQRSGQADLDTGVSGSQTGTGRNTSDCFQHLFTT